MIKPTYLWALCKTCTDSAWIGDICRNLGGQDVELDFGQRQVADMIKMDSEWMDERINWNREAARMRQARARERRATEGVVSRDVTRDKRDEVASREVTPASRHPSIHPYKSFINKTPPHTPRRGGGAMDEAFSNFWTLYPDDCPRKVDKVKCRKKFAALYKAAGNKAAFLLELMSGLERWRRSETWTKDGGAYICAPLVWLNNARWLDEPKAADVAQEDRAEAVVAHHVQPQDWELCAERCSRCLESGEGCQAGYTVPPPVSPVPHPPEECPGFLPMVNDPEK